MFSVEADLTSDILTETISLHFNPWLRHLLRKNSILMCRLSQNISLECISKVLLRMSIRVYSATKVFLFFFFNPKNTDVAQNPNQISVAASCPNHPSLDFMQTCSQSSKGSSSPPQSISSLSAANAPGNLAPVVHHSWTTEEEQALIDFLAEHASEAGNGASFTKITWNQATTFMSNRFPQYTFKSDQLSGKWQRVHHFVIYQSTIAY